MNEPVPSSIRRKGAAPRTLLASQICIAGEKISTLCEQLHFWQDQSQDLQNDLREKLAQKAAVAVRHEHRSALVRRLEQLQGDLRRRREGVERLKELSLAQPVERWADLHRSEFALQACASVPRREVAEKLREAQERLQELQVDQKAGRVQQDEATRSLQKSWQRLRCQQIRKLSEVRQVYPVQQCQAYWTIRGIGLRRTETLKHQDPREEQDASTALGYLSHLLVSAASLLQVPLQMELNRVGSSRCFVVDATANDAKSRSLLPKGTPGGPRSASGRPFMAGRERRQFQGEWPLHYGRAIEKTQFETALRLLEQSLHQFLYSRGYLNHQKLQGGNLLKCAEAIFTHEIYAGESPP